MKTLLLVRHAKAEPHTADGDHARALNARGRGDAPRVGAWLAAEGFQPGFVCSSTAARAHETAVLLSEALGFPAGQIDAREGVYGAGVRELLALVRTFGDAHRSAMLVGHNPTMHEFAEYLTRERLAEMPTCTAVWVDLDIRGWHDIGRGSGQIRRFVTPRHLREEH